MCYDIFFFYILLISFSILLQENRNKNTYYIKIVKAIHSFW